MSVFVAELDRSLLATPNCIAHDMVVKGLICVHCEYLSGWVLLHQLKQTVLTSMILNGSRLVSGILDS